MILALESFVVNLNLDIQSNILPASEILNDINS